MEIQDGAKAKLKKVGAENLSNEELVRAFLDSFGQSQKINQLTKSFLGYNWRHSWLRLTKSK